MNTIFTATRATWPMLADMQDQLQLAPSTVIPADLSPFCLLFTSRLCLSCSYHEW